MDAGDEVEFRDFATGRSPALLRSAYLLTGDRAEAEDAVQEALTKLYLAWPRIRHRDAVDAYARKVLLHEVLSWRRRRRVALVLGVVPPERAVGADEAAGVGVRDEVHRALLALPARQRAVVVLRYFDDLSEAQTAVTLGISTGAVKQHASRALAHLRDLLPRQENELR
jgi:RNA polymerase sigma-70 factor, ECF subfamily